ncbi:MAG: glycoside hydrolase [Firmicutes bacterium HGW-Firmicutes-1]|jgi:lysozyme|nr:MAG: glycoside hydrolase [Firmicutes bacterium HGW-Firmicutes-1]
MKKKGLRISICIIVIVCILGTLEFSGIIWHTEYFARTYKIKGLDVSHYQNTIDWDKVSKEYKFIFLKATEGEDFIDRTFDDNWEGAKDNGFLVGAYHFFVTSSSGEDQANNFIRTVPVETGSLPAVIDIEVSKNEDKEMVRENLTVMINMIAEKYGSTPILYVTYATYDAFIMGYFDESKIWIRDILRTPKLEDGREWVFWQYSNRGRIQGIDTYVDINVFYGNEDELIELTN